MCKNLVCHDVFLRPCCLKETLFHALSSNPEERRSFEVQAAKDWERILLKRATELKKGDNIFKIDLGFEKGSIDLQFEHINWD